MTDMKEDVEGEVKAIVAETLRIAPESVTSGLAVGDVDEWDSMGNMAIIAALEERMGVEFPLDDLFDLTSVEAFVEKIKELCDD